MLTERAFSGSTARPWRWASAAVWLWLATGAVAAGQETSHYLNGTSGLKAATLPPPGNYWLAYNYAYSADQLPRSNAPPLDVDVDTYASAHRFVFVTDKKLFGADYAWNFVVPFVWNSVEITDFGIQDSSTTFGDFFLEPFVIEWHKPRYDFGFVYGLVAPTGQRDINRPSLPGKNCWTNYFGFGGTWYFDEKRTWTASLLSRYEIHTQRRDLDLVPGDDFSFEWGLGKTFEETMTVGVSGYCAWHVTADRGPDVISPTHNRACAMGPEVQAFFPKLKLGLQARSWWEFAVKDRTQGHILTVTFVKPF